jgi:AhpD family alkylhydroperoxidase
MSIKIFQDKIFPRHLSDLMNLMHMIVFTGTDGEEKWETYLTVRQKELVALALALYYQCDHCVEHHTRAVSRLEKIEIDTLLKNINSIILFLRIDTRIISKTEKQHWITSWQRFAKNISIETKDQAISYLIGLAIGIARDDEFLIQFCGKEVYDIYNELKVNPLSMIGELEAVVIFMKAAASKNRVVSKITDLVSSP